MSIRFNKQEAEKLVRAAADVDVGHVDPDWLKKVEKLSELCEAGGAMTHIAFLGTAMIARALRADVDLFAIKPKHAPDNPKAYSARILCEKVLARISQTHRGDLSSGADKRGPWRRLGGVGTV